MLLHAFLQFFLFIDLELEHFHFSGTDTIHLEHSHSTERYHRQVTGLKLLSNHFIATILKKFYINLHGWRMLLLMFVYPFGWMILSMIARINLNFFGSAQPLHVEPDLYSGSVTILQSDGSAEAIASAYEKIVNGRLITLNGSLQEYLLSEKPNSAFSASVTRTNLTAFFDNEAFHSAPLAVNVLYNAILQSVCADCSIHVTNYPVNQKQKDEDEQHQKSHYMDVEMSYATFVAVFIMFYVQERVCRSKLLQIVSGMNIFIYWLASFLWDMMIFFVFTAMFFSILAISQGQYWSDGEDLFHFVLVIICFGCTILPLIYLASFLFRVPSRGLSASLFFGLIFGKYLDVS